MRALLSLAVPAFPRRARFVSARRSLFWQSETIRVNRCVRGPAAFADVGSAQFASRSQSTRVLATPRVLADRTGARQSLPSKFRSAHA
jgi:hypothetical protein